MLTPNGRGGIAIQSFIASAGSPMAPPAQAIVFSSIYRLKLYKKIEWIFCRGRWR
jgi:hypothetical protein